MKDENMMSLVLSVSCVFIALLAVVRGEFCDDLDICDPRPFKSTEYINAKYRVDEGCLVKIFDPKDEKYKKCLDIKLKGSPYNEKDKENCGPNNEIYRNWVACVGIDGGFSGTPELRKCIEDALRDRYRLMKKGSKTTPKHG